MRRFNTVLSAFAAILILASTVRAQSTVAPNTSRLINITGTLRPADGQPLAPVESVTLAIYSEESGGTPLWQETQSVQPGASGRFTALLGATQADGVPVDVFASGEARWLGITLVRPGESEGQRMRLTRVPYAVQASNAETLGGRPASAYLLASSTSGDGTTGAASTRTGSGATSSPLDVTMGTPNLLAKYMPSGTDVGNSSVYESGGFVGVGTTTPFDVMHLRFNNTTGSLTGLAVQNLGGTAASYSGMLFYDHLGQLVQFQGFNNATHEYRINNIARNGAAVFDGSINFLTGSTSRLMVASNGNIGIGTTTPTAKLQVAGIVAADDVSYSTPQTSYYAVNDAAFSSRDGASFAAATGSGGAYPTTSTGFGLAAPVNLPHGATITNVRFFYVDNATINMHVFLFSHSLGGAYQVIADHTSAVQTTAIQTVDVPASWTVDNSGQSLVAVAFPEGGAWSNSLMMIRGLVITYTMPRPAR